MPAIIGELVLGAQRWAGGRIAGSSAPRSAASGCSHWSPGRSPTCTCTGHVNRTATFRSPLAYVRHRSWIAL